MRLPGTRLVVEDWLGDGATSIVYRGRHVDLGRPIAIKVLRGSVSEVMRSRFLEEAQTTTRIDSPYVVDILDFGELHDGRLYYAMELLAGHSIADELDDGAVALGRSITLLRMACKGLAASHRLGVVHRDIKPENMLVVRRWGRQQLILLDFGLATVPKDSAEVCGTPAYMAPEQICGEAIDHRVDIYALGCCAYELMTGRQLVHGHTIDDLLQAHLHGVTPEFSPGDAVPAPLQAVVRRCLAHDRESRFESMEELEAALCEAQVEAGVRGLYDDLDPPEVVDERRRQRLAEAVYRVGGLRMRRFRRVAMAAGLIGALAAGAFGWVEQRREQAALAAQFIDRHVYGAQQAARATRFVYAPSEDDEGDTALHHVIALEAYDGPDRDDAIHAAKDLRYELAETLVALGDRYWDLDATRPYARDYYAQALLFDGSLRRARVRAGMTPGEVADLRARAEAQDFRTSELLATLPLVLLAKATEDPDVEPMRRGDTRRAERQKRDDGGDRERVVIGPTPQELAGQLAASAAARQEEIRQAEARERERARARAAQSTREGRQALESGELARAKEQFEEALRAQPHHAEALAGLSDTYFEQGRHQQAMHFAQLALRRSPRNARNHVRLADAYYRVARYDDARTHYRKAARLGSKLARRRLKLTDR